MSIFANLEVSSQVSPLKPGCPIAVSLVKAELSKVNAETGKGQDGNLVISFKGTHMDNAGTSRFIFWIDNQDPTNPKYNKSIADNALNQVLTLCNAFAPANEVAYVTSSATVKEAFSRTVELLTSKVGSLANIKAVYRKNSDEDVVFPNFGDFISTELAPAGLVLSSKAKDGVPYERVLPLSAYGIVAPSANSMPAVGGIPAFAAPTAAPAFGTPVATPAFATPAAAPVVAKTV